MARYEHQGGAKATTLASDITAAATSFTVADATNWPTGSTNPFWVVIDRGKAAEEKILCTSRTGTLVTVSSRGQDGTSAASHDGGATVEHCLTATEIDKFDAFVEDHGGAADPHPVYLTSAEGNDAYVGVAGDTMTGPLLLSDGTAAAPGVGFSSDAGGTGFIRTGLGSIGTTLNGTQHYAHQASRFIPIPDNTLTLGGSGFRWSQLWAGTTTINTSDETQKNTVVDTPLGLDFVKAVRPIDFVYNGRRRTHVGFSAQQVSEALAAVGAGDRAIYVDPAVGAAEREAAGPPAKQKDESTEDHAERVEQWRDEVARDKAAPKGLRYSELIAPLYRAVQEQQAIIEQQAATIADLVSRVEALEASK